jgi:uncharacterized protein (TIGR02996 family)
MSDEQTLIAYCRQHPDDDQARLVYADWVEEHGDAEKAEFIRVQVAQSRAWEEHPDEGQLQDRAAALLETNEKRWRAALPTWCRKHAGFRRGLPTHVELTASQLLTNRRVFGQQRAFDSLRLRGCAGKFLKVIEAGLLAGLRELDVAFEQLTEEDLLALAGCPDLAGLRSLDVGSITLSDDVCEALAGSPHLAGLKTLEASWCNPALLAALAGKGVKMRLRRFQMVGDGEEVIAKTLAQAPAFSEIEELGLSFNQLDGGLKTLVRSPALPRLRWLSLWGCDVESGDLGALARSNRTGALEYLGLNDNHIGAAGARALARAGSLGRLTSLNLGQNPLGDDGVAALARANLPGLRRLDLSEVGLTARGLAALARAPWLPSLRQLILSGNQQMPDEGIRALVQTPALRSLEALELWDAGVGDDALRAIAESPYLGKLRRLWMGYNQVGPAGAAALAESPHLPSLREVSLVENRIGERGALALLDSPLLDRLAFLSVESNGLKRATRQRLNDRRGGPSINA